MLIYRAGSACQSILRPFASPDKSVFFFDILLAKAMFLLEMGRNVASVARTVKGACLFRPFCADAHGAVPLSLPFESFRRKACCQTKEVLRLRFRGLHSQSSIGFVNFCSRLCDCCHFAAAAYSARHCSVLFFGLLERQLMVLMSSASSAAPVSCTKPSARGAGTAASLPPSWWHWLAF